MYRYISQKKLEIRIYSWYNVNNIEIIKHKIGRGIIMNKDTNKLTLGEKIREIRKFLFISQENLAKAVGCGTSTISRIENEQAQCSEDLLRSIRKALGTKNAPILENESIIFRERLNVWRDLINVRSSSLNYAKDMGKNLSTILYIPFEHELAMLYIMYEVKLLIVENNLALAEKRMSIPEDISEKNVSIYDAADANFDDRFYEYHLNKTSLTNLSSEILYHYYYNKGSICVHRKQYKDALKYYLKANSLEVYNLQKEYHLLYNIAICYGTLCMPMRSILYLEKAYNLFRGERASPFGLSLDNALAVNYTYIGESRLAQELLEKCLILAKGTNNLTYIGISYHNLGVLHLKNNHAEKAIEYFNQSLEHSQENDAFYLEYLYYKIRCMIELGKFNQSKKMIERAKKTSSQYEKYSFLFGSLMHLMTLSQNNSCQYLTCIAIPRMLEDFELYKALDFCKQMEIHFKSKNQTKKVLETAATIRSIYEKIIFVESGVDI